MLQYLRSTEEFSVPVSKRQRLVLFREARYYGMEKLMYILKTYDKVDLGRFGRALCII